MKKSVFIIILFSLSLYGQSRTRVFSLPQWNTYDTLRAGTVGDATTSSKSLNNLGARLDTILSVQIDSSGYFRSVYGRGSGNLTIDAGIATASPQRIILNDSLYSTYNFQTTANMLIGGNLNIGSNAIIGGNTIIGGYISLDSVQGNMQADSVQSNTVSYKLFEQSMADAGSANNDTSAYTTTEWQQDTTRNSNLTYKRKAKFLYLHKSGIKYIKTYFLGKASVGGTNCVIKIEIRNSSGVSIANTEEADEYQTSYGNSSASIEVSGLTADTKYIIEIQMRAGSGAIFYVKELIVMAESL
jgi:hypothetical protein